MDSQQHQEQQRPENRSDSSTDDSLPDNASYRANELASNGKRLSTKAKVHDDGRVNLSLACQNEQLDLPADHAQSVCEFAVDSDWDNCPRLSIVIMIVGSRGDVQPYVALGKRLKQDGHNVRIATHETFRNFVTDEGLKFFNIGGNPVDLMSYMVKNPGLIPGLHSLTDGEIRKKRAMLKEMIQGCWESCYASCQETGDRFVADAIISNPPGFAHLHCAQALGIPLQMTFTMPWSPTTAFPHPLTNITSSNAKPGLTNYLSYLVTDLLTWQGTGDIINKFRKRVLGLGALDLRTGSSILESMKVPWTYCMSPALVPKPEDWKNYIDVVGFYFLDLATDYQPSPDLVTFLNAGDPPIYIGFGSIVVDDPQALTRLIFDATAEAGVRALVSAGWGGLGDADVPSHVFMLGNVPHDWLFDKERVCAVVHHGGAGTTAIGLNKGRPTVVVPFFGDQGFWGDMIHKAGAGPKPIPHKKLTVAKLRDAIKYALGPEAKEAARRMSQNILNENGVQNGARSFYQHLPLLNMRCDLDPNRLAVWWSTRQCLKLSAFAALTLANAGLIDMNELELHRTKEYHISRGVSLRREASSVLESITDAVESLFSPVKEVFEISAAVPHGIMRMVSSPAIPSHSERSVEDKKEKGPPKHHHSTSSVVHGMQKALSAGHADSLSHLLFGGGSPEKKQKDKGVRHQIKDKAREFYRSGVRAIESHIEQVEQHRCEARVIEGVDAYSNSTAAERERIVESFRSAKGTLLKRRMTYISAAKKVLESHQQIRNEAQTIIVSSETTNSADDSEGKKVEIEVQDWDAAFEKDLALALQISLRETSTSVDL